MKKHYNSYFLNHLKKEPELEFDYAGCITGYLDKDANEIVRMTLMINDLKIDQIVDNIEVWSKDEKEYEILSDQFFDKYFKPVLNKYETNGSKLYLSITNDLVYLEKCSCTNSKCNGYLSNFISRNDFKRMQKHKKKLSKLINSIRF